jgi:integrase/recombinase XerD
MTSIKEALTAYRICAQAEGKSPRTIEWICCSIRYFTDFLGGDRPIEQIGPDDLRAFIIALQARPRFSNHPYARPQPNNISPQSIQTYARAIRAFFGFLQREELIDTSPMLKVKMPKVPYKVVPTFSAREVERLLSQPNQHTRRGFRDYLMLLLFVDTAARLSEVASLKLDDVDLEQGYLHVMGKGGKERYIPFGNKVAKMLLKYKMKHRPDPMGTDHFFLASDGRPLCGERISAIVRELGQKAGLKRCYPHKLRHTGSVLYLRNGGDPFSLQKKLGHTSLSMTRHYSNLADSDVRAQHMKFGVADRLKA